MLDRLSNLPTPALASEASRLEHRLIQGIAAAPEIDVFVAMASELGRRSLLPAKLRAELDGVLDPRD